MILASILLFAASIGVIAAAAARDLSTLTDVEPGSDDDGPTVRVAL